MLMLNGWVSRLLFLSTVGFIKAHLERIKKHDRPTSDTLRDKFAEAQTTPLCIHCGESITDPAINFDAPSDLWQCADCHHIEWGSWPFGSLLSMPEAYLATVNPDKK